MPLKLREPRPGRTPYYTVRGTHLGVYVEKSTGCTDKAKAAIVLRQIREGIERRRFARQGEPVFLDAIDRYIAAGGETRFLGAWDAATGQWSGIAAELGALPLSAVDQAAIDATAIKLLADATPATRNRQVYTPVSAVLKHAGIVAPLRRPKGWRGRTRTDWMTPKQAFRILRAARAADAELGVFLTVLLYTGMRLGEALALTCDRVNLGEAHAFLPATKNGDPRAVYLPQAAVAALANLPKGLDRPGRRVFRFRKGGRLYALLRTAREAAGADLAFVSFHVFRHTWAAWMRRYGGLDTTGLVATRAWRDRASAARYEHAVPTEEARRARFLPVEGKANRRSG